MYIMASRTMERDWEKRIVTILGKEYDYGKLSPEMKDMAGFLGFGTKLVDNLAGMKAYTSEEKLKKVEKLTLQFSDYRTATIGRVLSRYKELGEN